MWRFAHLALQNHNILPEDFMRLPADVRLFLIASDEIQTESIKNLERA